MKDGQFSRRDFFYLCVGGGLVALGYPLVRAVSQSGDGKRAHRPTPDNTLGPYYREGAPVKTRLTELNDQGTPLIVSGRVRNTDDEPLPAAVIEVFQADHRGDYDLQGFRYRGRIPLRGSGEYTFMTVVPGQYGGRAQHIHYVVNAPGHKTLVTQLYFENDPKFEGNPDKNYRRDNLVGHRELIRPVSVVMINNTFTSSVNFDIYLEKA
jgi:protocatechuate 3,4-dioxygenase beta subunit